MDPQSLTVLLVEPHEPDWEKHRRMLSQLPGWDVKLVRSKSAQAAQEHLKQRDVDVVITEQALPDVTGLKWLRALREQGTETPVIMFTSQGSEHLAGQWMRAGGDDYWPKQELTSALLSESLRRVVDKFKKRKNQNEEIQRLRQKMHTDPLTGLYNRRYLMNRLKEELNRVQRYESMLTVMLLDLDDFKRVNDAWGHPRGDKVLKTIAQILQEETRESDVVVRYGGDEFLLILPQTRRQESTVVLKRLRACFRREFQAWEVGEAWCLRFSAGVVEIEGEDLEPEEVLQNADEALYEAKRKGGDREEYVRVG